MPSSRQRIPFRLNHPIADGLLQRTRLFALLDRFRARPISWVEAPPGAGKTSLVSSWIAARNLKALWYSVDSADHGPADFFHFLRSAAFVRGLTLPALTPEHRGDLPGFTRRFFASLVETCSEIDTIVVDNFQEAPSDSPLATLLVAAAEVLAPAVVLIVISRGPPPAPFAKAVAHADLARLGAGDLLLTFAETSELASECTSVSAQSLFQLTQGWAAGVRLLLDDGMAASIQSESSNRKASNNTASAGPLPDVVGAATPAVFDLLALKVFERSPQDLRELWLSTAWFTQFTALMAVVASGIANAGELLEDLASRRYFVDRRGAAVLTCEYHPLFAEFLRTQVRRRESVATVRESMLRSARQLADVGEIDAALTLTIEAGDANAAVPLILERAAYLLAQGRIQTLCMALESLPPARLKESPWLLYWLGVARAATAPRSGQACVQRALRCFIRTADATGQAMCIAAVIDGFFIEWNHVARVRRLIDAAKRVVALEPRFPGSSSELRFYSSLIVGLAYIRPADPLADLAAARVNALLESDAGVNEKVIAASNLIQYLTIVGELRSAMTVRTTMARLVERSDLLPISRLASLHAQGFVANALSETGVGLVALMQARLLVEKNGFGFARDITHLFTTWVQLEDGRRDGAMEALAQLEPNLGRMSRNEVSMFYFLRSWVALLDADNETALESAQRAVKAIENRETVGAGVCCHAIYSIALARCKRFEDSLAAARRTRHWVSGLRGGGLRTLSFLVEADALFCMQRDDEAAAALATALATGRFSATRNTCIFIPDWLGCLCARAMTLGIEREYVADLIAARGLRSPSRDLQVWPWPIRVLTLGQFDLLVDGRSASRGRKAQRRVLDLLCAILALGSDDVNRDAVTSALWPDLDGAAARDAFEITLHRLRKLLGRDDTVLLAHGSLQLNPALVWTDAGTFERLSAADPQLDIESARRALTLYNGPFLGSHEESAWLFPAQERIRERYLRLATVTGQWLERTGNHRDASLVYAKALEFEPLAEALYRGLIGCLVVEGRRAEALEVYRRCRRMLSVVLSVAPSDETEALRYAIEHRV